MSNFREMTLQIAPEYLSDNNSNFKNINILYIALKYEIWRFRICNYFRDMFKFCDFMNTFRNFSKSVFGHIFAQFKYLAKQFILTESPDHVLKDDQQRFFEPNSASIEPKPAKLLLI